MKKILLFLLVGLLCLPAYAAQTGGISADNSTLSSNYLKLDCSNDPLTGELDLGGNNLTTIGTLEGDRVVLGGAGATLQIHGATFRANLNSNSESILDLTSAWVSHSDTAVVAPVMYFARSRGDTTAETVVQDGDTMGSIFFSGYDGTDYNQSALISSKVDGTPGANDMPGSLIFSTSPTGTNETIDRVTINAVGETTFAGSVEVQKTAYFANGQRVNRTAVATNAYTALSSDYIIGVNTGEAATITLPTTSVDDAGVVFIIKDESGDASTYNITITGEAGETIDGAGSQDITGDYNAISVYSDGTNWFIW
jgi:hypothetical protein